MSGPEHQPEQPAVRHHRVGAVLELIIDHPPVNALSQVVRAGLLAGIAAAEADADIGAVVIRAAGRGFSAGADIAEFSQPPRPPLLADVCGRIEACSRPVVAALHGSVLGGGLELALAAQVRVGLAAGVRLGFPEVGLGILPGAGGTQRLPRLIGAEAALRLMLTGRPVGATEALAMGLLDRVVEDGLEVAALAAAEAAMAGGAAVVPTRERRDGMRDPLAYQAAVAVARQSLHGTRLPGPARMIDCVEAAQLLPFEQGQTFERAAHAELLATPEAAALRHAFLAERRLTRMPEAGVEPRRLLALAVIGAAAADTVLELLQAGYPVVLVDADRAALVAALELVAAWQEAAVQAGRLSPEARDADWARLTPALAGEALAAADLVLAADGVALAQAARETQPGTVLVRLGPGDVAAGLGAADMLGLQFAPAGRRLAEVIVWPDSAPDAVATVLALLRRLRRRAVRVQAPGGIGGQVMAAGRATVAHLVAAGLAPEALAAALAGFGLPGLAPDVAVGEKPPVGAQAIVDRVLAAMANAGARLVGQGAVLRPSDIDMAVILGHGFPRWQGGPMFWADRCGLLVLRRDLRAWADEAPEIWGVAPLIDDLISLGRGFDVLNED
ncbi:MAG: enoyl-CoA hydratase-related protein [Pseudorhodobacter sp.]|nr:enoyl-CoA hydratase-related protein [Pseudorhodobacter sp.]